MNIIGLTGGIGSGKTKIANYLAQLGADVLDADLIARDVVIPGSPALQEITDTFGPGVLHSNGTLNRAKLASVVFNNPAALQKLNKITHPQIIKIISTEIAEYIKEKNKHNIKNMLILVAPLLIETGLHHLTDQVWVIHIDAETQLNRLMARDKLTKTAALKRINSQLPESKRLKHADEVIDNSGTWENTQKQILSLWTKYTNE